MRKCPKRMRKDFGRQKSSAMRIIDEHVEYLTPTVEQLKQWFDEFNERFFSGDLEPIQVVLTLLDEGTMAAFHYAKRKYDPVTSRYLEPLDIAQCSIRVAKNLFDSEFEWRNTLLHEMVHYTVYKHAETLVEDPHGEEFKREARRINRESEFSIAVSFEHDVFAPGKRKQQELQNAQERQLILGVLRPDEVQRHNRFSGGGFYATFLTEEQHIPMLVENWRHMTAEIDWYRIDACSKRMLLFEITTWAWDEITNAPSREGAIQKLLARGGSFETTQLGTTLVDGEAISGWCPTAKRPRFRANYALREELCAKAGASHLLRYADKVVQAANTNRYYTGGVAFSKSPCKLDFDSRFGRVRVFSPRALRINPVSTDGLVEALNGRNQKSLAAELLRLIRFENDIWI